MTHHSATKPNGGGRRWGITLLLISLASLLAACSSVHVHSAVDRKTNFAAYRTFNFAETPMVLRSVYFQPVNQERARMDIQRELEQRGLRLSDHPELKVRFYLTVADKVYDPQKPTSLADPAPYAIGKYYSFTYGRDYPWNPNETVDYKEGTLVIDFVDANNYRLVWQALVTGILYPNRADEQMANRIREAIDQAFKQYPG